MSCRITKLLPSAAALALMAGTAAAQTYTVTDLTPSAGNATATGLIPGLAGGYSSPAINGSSARALAWDSAGEVDLHPSALVDDPVTGLAGRSYIHDVAAGIQVGAGIGIPTGNRQMPVVWRNAADSAALLPIPFVNAGGVAYATDGAQIVGYATGMNRDGTTLGTSHAVVWDAATLTGTDLGDGGSGAIAYDVRGGMQAGMVIKGSASAAVWRGTARSLVVLTPKNSVLSVASATDGVRQAGYAGYDIRVRVEAAKGNKDQRFNYATVWTGTPESALNIHPYPANMMPNVNFTNSYALAMNGRWVVGYAGDQNKFSTPAYSHAIVWDADYSSIDLNAFLPAGFVGAQATGVDENGNICGYMSKADGTRHAVVWTRNAGA